MVSGHRYHKKNWRLEFYMRKCQKGGQRNCYQCNRQIVTFTNICMQQKINSNQSRSPEWVEFLMGKCQKVLVEKILSFQQIRSALVNMYIFGQFEKFKVKSVEKKMFFNEIENKSCRQFGEQNLHQESSRRMFLFFAQPKKHNFAHVI